MSLSDFTDAYFAFLLSGRAEDFHAASEAFDAAVKEGASIEILQSSMNNSHTSAEMLCLMVDGIPGEKTS
jgi:hypothetical protein